MWQSIYLTYIYICIHISVSRVIHHEQLVDQLILKVEVEVEATIKLYSL